MDVVTHVRTNWDRAAAWVSIAVGLFALQRGYDGVASTPYLVEQLPYVVSGGLLGIFLLGVGATLCLSADLRDEWRKLDDLDAHLDRVEAALRERSPEVP